jgi:hypothetical protein
VSGAFEFEWDEANTGHLTQHEVTREEFDRSSTILDWKNGKPSKMNRGCVASGEPTQDDI